MSAQAKQELSHSEEQAIAQLESIVEMVAALDRKSATIAYVKSLDDEQIQALAIEASVIEPEDENLTVDNLRERILWEVEYSNFEPEGFEFDEEEAREMIQEDPLSVQVRSDWYTLGADETERAPAEFEILLCTGGPAVRIVGDLDQGSPSRPRIQHQDWGTTWTEYFPSSEQREALQTYCEQFYFGD